MGYVLVTGRCLTCRKVFSFNPERVPSHPARDGVPVDDPSAPAEPICAACVALVNKGRAAAGRPTYTIYDDSYGPMGVE